MITRTFKLCLNAGNGSAPYINVNQYDEGETWLFELYSENGERYIPSSGAIVGVKSDGHGIVNTGTVDSEGRVVITETQQMTASAGRAIYELSIDGLTHGTANFIVAVERKPTDDAVMSDSDLSLIQEAVDAASEIETLLDGQDVPTVITPIIADWLDDNITNPSNPPIDTSLTVAGAAADAKKVGDELSDLKSAITSLDETVNGITSTNYTEGKKLDDNGSLADDATVCVSDKITYNWTGSTRYYCNDNTSVKYAVCFYDSSDNLLKRFQVPSSTGGEAYRSINAENNVEGTISYVRFSFKKGTTGEIRKNVSPSYELLWSAVATSSGGIVGDISEMQDDIEALQAKVADAVVQNKEQIQAKSATLTNATLTAIESIDIRKNMDIDFRADITSFTSVTVGHGYMINYGAWAVVDSTNVTIYANQNGEQIAQYAHGLTIDHYIHVLIQQGDNTKATLVIETASGRFRQENVSFDSRRGNFYATVNGTFTNVSLTTVLKDLNKDVWMFGDSYQSIGDPKRYPYYLAQDGYINNCLMSGFPGANAGHQITSFRKLITLGKPKYVVWCLGTNGSDSESAINATWQTCTDEVISTCESLGVIPILATIPNAPDRIQTFKDAYVKATGKRYIDFARAVGAESVGSTWYTGMLSSDNLHPSETGAMALYAELLADFPEIMESK